MNGLNWNWIVVMLVAPPLASLLVAYPLWRLGQPILGNLAGTVVVFGAALGLIGREYVEVDRVTQACLDAGTTCWATPGAFTRFAVYAGLGLLEVIALFVTSIQVEARLRRARYAPEWR